MKEEEKKIPEMPNPFDLGAEEKRNVKKMLDKAVEITEGDSHSMAEYATTHMAAILAAYAWMRHEAGESKDDIILVHRRMSEGMENFIRELE